MRGGVGRGEMGMGGKEKVRSGEGSWRSDKRKVVE